MAMFNRYVSLPEGNPHQVARFFSTINPCEIGVINHQLSESELGHHLVQWDFQDPFKMELRKRTISIFSGDIL